jgi:hypothetical protein
VFGETEKSDASPRRDQVNDPDIDELPAGGLVAVDREDVAARFERRAAIRRERGKLVVC